MDEQAKKTFILYADQWEAIKNLSDPKLGRLFRCLYRYVLGELDMSEVKADIYTAFMFLKTQIDVDKTKYEKRIEKSKKMASARWEKKVKSVKKMPKYAQAMHKHTQAMHKHSQAMHKHSQAMHNDNGDDNDNVDDNVNVDVNVDADGDADVNENVAAAAASKNTDGEPSVSAAAPAAEKEWKKDMTEQEMENFVAWFNHYMKESKIPCVRNITQKRRRLMREIWDNHNLSDLKRAFYQASQSSFLNNRTKRHFLANFDWIMQPENFDRILEGNFND